MTNIQGKGFILIREPKNICTGCDKESNKLTKIHQGCSLCPKCLDEINSETKRRRNSGLNDYRLYV